MIKGRRAFLKRKNSRAIFRPVGTTGEVFRTEKYRVDGQQRRRGHNLGSSKANGDVHGSDDDDVAVPIVSDDIHQNDGSACIVKATKTAKNSRSKQNFRCRIISESFSEEEVGVIDDNSRTILTQSLSGGPAGVCSVPEQKNSTLDVDSFNDKSDDSGSCDDGSVYVCGGEVSDHGDDVHVRKARSDKSLDNEEKIDSGNSSKYLYSGNFEQSESDSDGESLQINLNSTLQKQVNTTDDDVQDEDGGNLKCPEKMNFLDIVTTEIVPKKFKLGSVDVQGLLETQEKTLRQRRSPCTAMPTRVKTVSLGPIREYSRKADRLSSEKVSRLPKPEQIRRSWAAYIELLYKSQSDFFCSKEAKLKGEGIVSRGRPAYVGMNVSRENNNDIDEVYTLFYKSKDDIGASTGAYNQFCCVMGQYLRFAVVCGCTDVETVCESGMLYAAVTHKDIVVAYLTYFDVRATVSTVLTKALHLKKALFYAKCISGEKII